MKKLKQILLLLLMIGTATTAMGQLANKEDIGKLVVSYTNQDDGTIGTRNIVFDLCGSGTQSQTFYIFENSVTYYTLKEVSRSSTLDVTFTFALSPAAGPFKNTGFTNLKTSCGAGPHWHNQTSFSVSGSGTAQYELTNDQNNSTTYFTIRFYPPTQVYATQVSDMVRGLTKYYSNGQSILRTDLTSTLGTGATINWTATAKSGSTSVNPASIGFSIVNPTTENAYIPAFTAVNNYDQPLVITVTATLVGCPISNIAKTDFTIVIDNNTITDPNFKVVSNPVYKSICGTGSFGTIALSASNSSGTVSGASYEITYVNGDNVLDLNGTQKITGSTWTPSAARNGRGVYQITPRLGNTVGVPTLVTLESIAPLSANMLNIAGNLTYYNGDMVPTLQLAGTLPSGTMLTWNATGDAIGMQTSGNSTIPTFKAINTGSNTLSSTVNYTLAYISGTCSPLTGSFNINVQPKVISDPSLTVSATNTSQIICEGSTFLPIVLTSAYHEEAALDNATVKYSIKYKSGKNVISNSGTITSPWTPSVSGETGTGTYEITPIHNNNQGTPVSIEITVLPALNASKLVPVKGTLAYENGDMVPLINLTSDLPSNAKLSWTITSGNPVAIGMPAATTGVGNIQSFKATNITINPLTVNFSYTLEYTDKTCSFPNAAGTFAITALPKTIYSADLTMTADILSQAVCKDFEEIALIANNLSGDVPATFIVSFISGNHIIENTGLVSANWTPLATKPGKGLYQITPFYQNNQGVSVTIELELLPTLDLNNINYVKQNLAYIHGERVNELVLTGLPEGVIIEWIAPDGDHIGSSISGRGSVPSFIASNETNAPITVTYTLANKSNPAYCDGNPASVSFDVTVYPTPKAKSIEDGYYCNGSDIFIDLPTPVATDFYRLNFVSGHDFGLALNTNNDIIGTAINNTNKSLSGVYSLTAYNSATLAAGETVYFTVTVYAIPGLDQPESIITVNGTAIPSFQFTGNVEDGMYKWECTGRSGNSLKNNMPAKGEGNTFPAFVAENHGSDVIEYTYSVTAISGAELINGIEKVCEIENPPLFFTITIHPTPSIAGLENLEFLHKDSINVSLPEPKDGEHYELAFVSGTDLGLDLTVDPATGDVTIDGKAVNTGKHPIVATYSVTPINDETGQAGEPVFFTITVYPTPAVDQPKDLITVDGANVPSFEFTGNNSGGSYHWFLDNRTDNGLEYTMPVEGEGNTFPAFTAENHGKEPIVYTYKVVAYAGNELDEEYVSDTMTFTITIYPTPAATSLQDQFYCNGSDIEITLPTPAASDTLLLTFVSGYDFDLTLQNDNVTILGTAVNTTNGTLSGVYAVTAYNKATNATGETVYFGVTVYPTPVITQPKDIITVNNVSVPSFQFTGNVEGGTYRWMLSSRSGDSLEYALPIQGEGNAFPAFVAENHGKDSIIYTYSVVAISGNKMGENACISDTATFTITIYPTPAVDGIENKFYCNEDAIEFELPANTTDESYRLAFVSGHDFDLTLGADGLTITGTAENLTNGTLTGIYSVTAYNNLTEMTGKVVYFTVTVYPIPAVDDPKDIITVNNAAVPSFQFTGNTNGGNYQWELISRTDNGAEYAMPVKGEGGAFPAFVAENHGNASIVYIYSVVALTGTDRTTPCASEAKTFTITVHPTPTIAGLQDKNYCHNTPVELTLPTPATTDLYRLAFVSGTDLGLTLKADGISITGTTLNTTNGILSGVYSVTSYNKNTLAPGNVAYFVVTVYPIPAVDDPKDIITVNNAAVPSFQFTGNTNGGNYQWELISRTDNGTEYTMPVKGEGGAFPAFVAENHGSASIVYTYSVVALTGADRTTPCASEAETFTITVHPTPVIAGLQDQNYCHNTPVEITLPTPATTDLYRLAFVSGTDLNLTLENDGLTVTGTALNTTNGILSGVYSVTSYNKNTLAPGNVAYFVVTVYPVPAIDDPKDIITVNSAAVPSFQFTGNTNGGNYQWELISRTDNGTEYAMPVKGEGNIFPAFVAENHGSASIVYTYSVVALTGTDMTAPCASKAETFTITVHPTPAIAGLQDQNYCHNTAIDITLPTPAATDFYRLAFVSGTDLGLTLENDGVSITETALNTTNGTLSGVYSVTSYNKNTLAPGNVAYFVVTVYPVPAVNDPKDIITVNNAAVPSFQFTGNTNGGNYQWKLLSSTNTSVEYTMPVKGEGDVFPAFVAENNGSAAIVYTYSVVALTGTDRTAPCASEAETFTITVHPTPAIVGLQDKNYCHNTPVEITLPTPATTDLYRLAFVSGSDLGLTLENDGVTVTGTALNTTNGILSGVYSVTAHNKATNAAGATVYFVVTVYPELKAANIIVENKTYYNGQQVPAICFSGLTENVSYKWKLIGSNKIGSDTTGINCIPSFFATNTTANPITATYEVSMLSDSCSSADVKTFTITIKPSILDTKNLYATVDIVSQTVCFENSFKAVKLTLNHRLENINTDDVIFEWTLQGADVLGLGTNGRIVSTGSNTYNWNIVTSSTVTGTGVYTVTPIWKNYIGAPVTFTLTREAKPAIHAIEDIVVCNNSPLAVEFKGVAANYRWTVKDGSKLGIPNTGTGAGITVGQLVNSGKTVVTDIISVVPVNENGCAGNAIEIKVTVLPTVSVDQVTSILKGFGEDVSEIVFAGVATEYRWTSSNPMIAATPLKITSGTGNFPAFTTTVMGDKPELNLVTVTPVYTYGNVECTGTPMQFSIIVAPMPVIEHISDIEICEGEKIAAINFSKLNANANYRIAYEFSENIGLANNADAIAIPSFTAVYSGKDSDKQEVTVTVTPRLEIGGIKFTGKAITFTITVYPSLVLAEKESAELSICKGSATELSVEITKGYKPSIQWFKNGVAIPGSDAKKDHYTATESGMYYAVVTSRCGEAVGATYVVNLTFDVISQRWNDVLTVNMDPKTNGGYTFTNIEWYQAGSNVVMSNLSYLGNVKAGETYYIKANGGSFVSCEFTVTDRTEATGLSAYPNPVKGGEIVKVTGASGKIYITDIHGLLINAVDATGETTEVRMPSATGLYVITSTNNGKRKSVNVIVL